MTHIYTPTLNTYTAYIHNYRTLYIENPLELFLKNLFNCGLESVLIKFNIFSINPIL